MGDVSDMWPAVARTVPRARRKLADALDGWGLKDIAGTATLVLSELVTNAVTHAHVPGRRLQTRFIRTDRGVRLEVHDVSSELPVKRRAREDAEEGRGLALVEALTGPECWGYGSRVGVGKMVWAYVEPRPEDDGRTPA
jgi:anti-sigma regulatory factor (Ser/Thr protein kinase)